MLRKWPLLFIIIVLIEIYLFIKIGGIIGAFNTVLIVIVTVISGVQLLRYQGFQTLRRARQNMAQGQIPALEMMEGIVLAVGAALLITPGFFTDFLGLLCLLPTTRQRLLRYLLSHVSVQPMGAEFGNGQGFHFRQRPERDMPDDPHQSRGGRTLEGDYRRDDQA